LINSYLKTNKNFAKEYKKYLKGLKESDTKSETESQLGKRKRANSNASVSSNLRSSKPKVDN